MSHRIIGAVLTATLLATGCTDGPTGSRQESGDLSVAHQIVNPDQQVALALSLALRDASVRASLRDALRASPWTEHKLVLQDFARTPEGVRLLAAAAASAGMSVGSLRSVIAQLPVMDLYLPIRDHRLTWRATPDVWVAATLDQDQGSFDAFSVSGLETRYIPGPSAPAGALLLMHPAEPKGLRINRQADLDGRVVQDPGDGELGISIAHSAVAHMAGERLTASTASVAGLTRCPDGTPENQLYPYLKGVYLQDGAGETGALELRVHTYERNQYGSVTHGETILLTGLSAGVQYCVWNLMQRDEVGGSWITGARTYAEVWESDAGEGIFAADDLYGTAELTSQVRDTWIQPAASDSRGVMYLASMWAPYP